MEYQEPKMEITWLNMETIVHTSLTGEAGGSGDNFGGGGTQPWE